MRRSLSQLFVRPTLVAALAASALVFPASEPEAANVLFLFGVINDDSEHFADEWQRGVRATTFDLQWRLYEPQEGQYDAAYIAERKGLLAQLKSQGWKVQLVPGYHYVPDWLFANYPNMRFVNQYGQQYIPARDSFRVSNAPFNPQARALIAGYIGRIFQDFDPGDFDSIRLGGVVQGELRYPPPEWAGEENSYWAFDSQAQNPAVSGIPASVIGWRPGVDPNPGTVGRGQLIVNPSFENTHSYYAVPAWSPEDEVSAALTTASPHAGNRALSLNISSPHRVHQFVRAAPNTTYNFGGWVRSGDGSGRSRIILTQYDAGTGLLAGAPIGLAESSSQGWTDVSDSLHTSANTRFLKVDLDGHQPGNYFFDDLWLKKDGATDDQSRDIDVPLAFYDWYVQSLTDYLNWQIAQFRLAYAGQLDVLYAGKGIRHHQVTDALTNDLSGDGWSEGSSALYGAAAYDRHTSGLNSTADVALYLTGIDEPAAGLVDDTTPYPSEWSAARWIASLAQGRDMAVWGENSGQDDVQKLYLSAQRMKANGYLGLMWAFESELYSNPNPEGYATIDDLESVISLYNAVEKAYLPLAFAGG